MATWKKSSQYRDMPHQQYMQTEEGQRSAQFFREDAQRRLERRNTPQRTGFATGQAQSQQSPYTSSTPYQKNPSGDFAAYSPQQNTQQFGNTTLNQSYSPGTSPYGQAPQMPTSPTDGNWANYATQNRPAPFTARYGQPDGSFSDSPNYNQRDAFIQALNNQQTPYMTGQARGMPQYDIGSAFNQASQMVPQGFQNPFAPGSPSPAGQSQNGSPGDGIQNYGGSASDPRWSHNGGQWASPGFTQRDYQAQPRQYPVGPDGLAFEGALPNLAAQAFPSQYQGLTMAPQQSPRQAPQQGGLADIQRRLSNATTQEQLLEINRDGRAMMQRPARSAVAPSSGIRARGPGDPPERAAPRTRYQQEIDRMKAQGAYGPANPISEQERRMRTASPESMAQARREMEMSVARRRADDGQMPLRFQPGASQMVGGMVQSTGATGYGFGSGQGGGSPGAIGFLSRIEGQAEPSRPAMSLADRPSNPAARKSWDARYAAQNKNNPDGTPKSHYELNKDGAYKGMTEEEAMRQKFVGDSRGSAYNNDANFRAMADEKRRERMTPTMWASMQNETVENGVRRKGGFMRQADIDAQSQWLAARGLTGVPDGSRLDENKLYEDYLASTGTSVEERMAADRQTNAAREAERAALPPTYRQQQMDERARRAQSQEDIIRQFQQERGFDPRAMMSRPGNRSPIYI